MSGIFQFLGDFLDQLFVKGFWGIIKGFGLGVANIFNVPKYVNIFREYAGSLGVGGIILGALCCLLVLALLAGIILLIVLLVRKYVRFRKTVVNQEELLNEVATLNREVMKLSIEKDKILAMKVSQLGLRPGENPYLESAVDGSSGAAAVAAEGAEGEVSPEGTDDRTADDYSRFYKLTQVDIEMEGYEPPVYNNEITLPGIIDMFRNFAASRMGLYYEHRTLRLFLAAFASTRLIILQGISGTGKTSLPYSFGKFLQNDAIIASVQPSWRDRTELFGYFNEFTKRFNETEVLKKMYEATYKEDIYLTILDEMNIARVEYYFAEMLSILEMPSRDEWIVSLVPSVWPTDPKHLFDGKLKLPENMWYIGTINNDDSTFAVTDKVYDRAIPIDINTKGKFFEAPWTDNLTLSYKHLESMFAECKEKYEVSEESLRKLAELDDYVIEHFRLAFGNRIVKQLQEFVPAYVGCGGTEIDGLITYLNKHFGKANMNECKEYLMLLKKLM